MATDVSFLDPVWHREALCAETDPDAFFPDRGESTRAAKRICAQCDVRRQCLDYALAHDHRFGIWGGLTPRERHRGEGRQPGLGHG
ncbi:WhiB family transcriptional regulator [Nocardia sp. 2]|uniref:Transcriptional regulator WhiB n=1 Tax=Nocardia acididurans TaxID=2802282 RepID=A0ABS1LZZ0_9NOCA|nr:WhiB family transcriptional regulator [Nocardia acididurans]